jgi:hypothetical protein
MEVAGIDCYNLCRPRLYANTLGQQEEIQS